MIERSRVFDMGGAGIVCGDDCSVHNCNVRNNGSNTPAPGGGGIRAERGAKIRHNTVSENLNGDGVQTGNASLVTHNVSSGHLLGDGIEVGAGSNVSHNVARLKR